MKTFSVVRFVLVAAVPFAGGCAAMYAKPEEKDAKPEPQVLNDPKHAHPLDPLDSAELAKAVAAIKAHGKIAGETMFSVLALAEPTKDELASGKPLARRAFASLMEKETCKAFEAIVDLTAGKVASWQEIPGVQPFVFGEEFDASTEICRKDPAWQEAMKKRGITDFAKVHLDAWAAGAVPEGAADRLLNVIFFLQDGATNPYGRPIEGVYAVVSMKSRKVLRIVDIGVVPIPAKDFDFYDPAYIGQTRKPNALLEIVQKQGPGFEITSHNIRWDNWSFRWTMHPREALVLHDIAYHDHGRRRSVLARASVSETLVPYNDPDPCWTWRNAFDQGEYGIGRTCSSLRLGEDVPENAVLLDAAFAGDDGKSYVLPKCLAVYERGGPLLFRHYDDEHKVSAARRGRELVLFCITTIGNYDYGFNWIFKQDGSIEFEVDMTGILIGKGTADAKCTACEGNRPTVPAAGSPQRYGMLIGRNVVGVNHQHFFNMRLDFDIDGPKNSVAELNVVAEPAGPGNPVRNALHTETTVLATEKAAVRDLNPATHRRWKIFNPGVRTALGHYPGYIIEPDASIRPLLPEDAAIRKRAHFTEHNLWVTRNRPNQLWASGFYPNQSYADQGLPKWIAGDESIENTDIVVWYTFGTHHYPKPEDWPIMPTAKARFKIAPAGFFDRNPTLDVPSVLWPEPAPAKP